MLKPLPEIDVLNFTHLFVRDKVLRLKSKANKPTICHRSSKLCS
jgi:hypothetical protein